MHYSDSDTMCASLAEEFDDIIVSFSRGKDSIASYIQCKRYFKRVHCFYLYSPPGLKFVDESLKYFDEQFGAHIIQLPHPSFYGFLNDGLMQTWSRWQVSRDMPMPKIDYLDIYRVVREDLRLPSNTPVGTGVRMNDSPTRRTAIKTWGARNVEKGTFFPVFDWNKERLSREIRVSGLKLPIDYDWFGRSFDGLDERFTRVIREKAPDDYEVIRQWYPLVAADHWRMRWRREYHENKGRTEGGARRGRPFDEAEARRLCREAEARHPHQGAADEG